ncbi:hypothetical protein ASE37_18870 [Rhizobium sp. Root268]|nr:hypothetical protein ASC86_18370 [Rhizobium sp. Root1212]KRD21586.1 hypothetical protein ASE37_18870 [Rhizobium sp. Root268]
MVGIPTGAKTGFFALDVDVKEGKTGDINLAALEAEHVQLPQTAIIQTATGGFHYLFRHVDGLTTATGGLPEHIDIRAQGGYIIGAGSTFPDGRRYKYLGGTSAEFIAAIGSIAEPPAWLIDVIRTPRHGAVSGSFAAMPRNDSVSAAEVEELLSYISPDCAYQDWLSVLMAVHEELGDGGLAIADAWSAGGSKYRKGDVFRRWKTFKPGGGVGMGSLTVLARDGGADLSGIARRHRGCERDGTRSIDAEKLSAFVARGLAKNQHDASARVGTLPSSRSEAAQASGSSEPANDNTPPAPSKFSIFDWPSSRFVGEPPVVKELVEGTIPQAVPGMIAAMGDTGKSYAALELHRRVSFGSSAFDSPIFGGRVLATGTSVLVTSEDDSGEVHRRLAALDRHEHRLTDGQKLLVVPLPSAGGPRAFWREDKKLGLIETDDWKRLCDELVSIEDLRLVTLDPLASFAHVQINEDPAAGAFVCASLGALAAQTRASVLVLHHMKKVAKPIESLADAREAIRGSTALVDGLRLAYALWPAEEKRGRAICKDLGVEYAANKVVFGGVVKANGAARRIVSTYVRNDFGLLVDRTVGIGASGLPQDDLLEQLVAAIAAAAEAGQPLTKTGATGLFENRERLGEGLSQLSRHKIEGLAQRLVDSQRVVKCLAGGTTPKWLDVPTGRFAMGLGEFRKGMARG